MFAEAIQPVRYPQCLKCNLRMYTFAKIMTTNLTERTIDASKPETLKSIRNHCFHLRNRQTRLCKH